MLGVVSMLVALAVCMVGVPRAVRAISGWLRSLPAPSPLQVERVVRALAYSSPGFVPVLPFVEHRLLSDKELCQAWRASYPSVECVSSPRQLMDALDERRSYLDEMEERHPAAFAAWLASGATASDDPFPFLDRQPDDLASFDWDDLTRRTDGEQR